MSRPLVAIVGRPNVGKSMLFNKLCGRRLSIVEDTPGVTRDRLYAECEWCGRTFDIVDTGGIDDLRHRIVVRGKHGDLFAPLLHFRKAVSRYRANCTFNRHYFGF